MTIQQSTDALISVLTLANGQDASGIAAEITHHLDIFVSYPKQPDFGLTEALELNTAVGKIAPAFAAFADHLSNDTQRTQQEMDALHSLVGKMSAAVGEVKAKIQGNPLAATALENIGIIQTAADRITQLEATEVVASVEVAKLPPEPATTDETIEPATAEEAPDYHALFAAVLDEKRLVTPDANAQEGTAEKQLADFLVAQGYGASESGVRDFQGDRNIKIDGLFGPQTLGELRETAALKAIDQNAAIDISALQAKAYANDFTFTAGSDASKEFERLSQTLGVEGVTIDGTVTTEEIKALQTALGVTADGKFGHNSYKASERQLSEDMMHVLGDLTAEPTPVDPALTAQRETDGPSKS